MLGIAIGDLVRFHKTCDMWGEWWGMCRVLWAGYLGGGGVILLCGVCTCYSKGGCDCTSREAAERRAAQAAQEESKNNALERPQLNEP